MSNDQEEDSTEITPDFFSDIHRSDFVSVPINIKNDDEKFDQSSSYIDYNENMFKSAQDRQRDFIFKYEDVNPKLIDEETK